MTGPEVIKRVARAIYDAPNGIDGDQLADMLIEDQRITGCDIATCRKQVMALCVNAARSAIAEFMAATREPSEAMVESADNFQTDEMGDPCARSGAAVWRGMHAALARELGIGDA